MKVATVKSYVNVLKKKYFYTYKNSAQFTDFNLEKNNNTKIEDPQEEN